LFFNLPISPEKKVPLIITNKHVVQGQKLLKFFFSPADEEGNPTYDPPYVQESEITAMNIIYHPDPEVDLCAIPCGMFLSAQKKLGHNCFYVPISDSNIPTQNQMSSIDAIEDVIMIGYPNGLWDKQHNMPIVRKGITATPVWLNNNKKREFVIDIACFPGSSGSPVFILNLLYNRYRNGDVIMGKSQFYFMGILYGAPIGTKKGELKIIDAPTKISPYILMQERLNLGYILKADCILELEPLLKDKFPTI
jgi:hypothetical protein